MHEDELSNNSVHEVKSWHAEYKKWSTLDFRYKNEKSKANENDKFSKTLTMDYYQKI